MPRDAASYSISFTSYDIGRLRRRLVPRPLMAGNGKACMQTCITYAGTDHTSGAIRAIVIQ
jgi:hypothetical protein